MRQERTDGQDGRRTMRASFLLLATAAFVGLVQPMAAPAQSGPFAPVVTVDGQAVTRYELDQRIRFLTLLRFPGDVRAEAESGLIDDRLRTRTAKALGITVTPEQIKAGMEEFAGRANLTLDQFVAAIQQGGVDVETYRDFVAAGVAWREVIRQKYADRVTVSASEIERALSVEQNRGIGPQVLVSEIVIPIRGGNVAAARKIAREIEPQIGSDAGFASAARTYSSAPSRDRGGQLDWIPLTNLPVEARGALQSIGQGRVTPPIQLADALVIFKLRGLKPGAEGPVATRFVDYALMALPGGEEEAARVRARADTCDDLYTIARKSPAEALQRASQPIAQVPRDIASALSALDENESTTLVRGGVPVLLMLCDRSASGNRGAVPADAVSTDPGGVTIGSTLGFGAGPTAQTVADELRNQRLNGLAEAYLAELRSNADIRYP